MKERGIIFNSEMVRAILDGRKTQTRRVVNPQPELTQKSGFKWKGSLFGAGSDDRETNHNFAHKNCPLGKVGDRLWVRETFALLGNEDGVCVDWNDNILKAGEEQAARIYKASCEQKDGDYGLWSIPDDADWKPHTDNHKYDGTWTPSIHMPRWASRITLEITDVRVERLQEASDDDFKAEGYPLKRELTGGSTDAFCWFRHLWDSISKPECNFESNPWVWVIEFKRV
ncbi:hypothetical protein M0K80_RS05110 [Providencia rettgeri]|uniref:hypothetical protein n=1 Tax=Providencia TaxID=586 RepID=UPI001419602F|nr:MULTISPECIES: hypothetical protein [Providencia]EJD6538982.1 hypothetical protein [Providencia rettgeri]EJD6670250.1 hypothetical protein [Providencia rettgeri]ELR5145921.1 hypothetical protein [Providencia rettgeri]MCG9949627.1 hypothetical protein [Providencia rettgeri]NIA45377.1 hypothetical protein [Providencia rettgeri]